MLSAICRSPLRLSDFEMLSSSTSARSFIHATWEASTEASLAPSFGRRSVFNRMGCLLKFCEKLPFPSRVRIFSTFPSNFPSILPWTYNYVLPLFRPHAPEEKTEGVCIISTLSVYLVNNPLTPLWRQPLKRLSHLWPVWKKVKFSLNR